MSVSQTHSPRAADRRLSLAVGIILIAANLRAPITNIGPLLPDIQSDLGLNATLAGLLNALPLLIFAALSLVAPALGRRYGLERVLGGSVCAILVGTIIRSQATPGALWAGMALLSVGIALANVLLPGLVKRDFPDRAPMLIGLYAAAMAGMAGLSAGLAVPLAHDAGLGWQWSLGVWSLLALGAGLAWLPQLTKPQGHGDGGAIASASLISPWRHPIGWQVAIFFALHSLVFYAIVDWYASYAAASGIDLSTAGFYLLVFQLVAITTNLGSASIIRRARSQSGLGFACGLFLLIGTGGLLLRPDLSLLWLISAGLGAGIAMVTSLSLFALRTQNHHQAAALSGMAQFIGYIGAAIGPLLVGVLRDLTGNWTVALAPLVIAGFFVMIFASMAGRNRTIG